MFFTIGRNERVPFGCFSWGAEGYPGQWHFRNDLPAHGLPLSSQEDLREHRDGLEGQRFPRGWPRRRCGRPSTEAMRAKTDESPSIKSKMDDVTEAVAAVKRDLRSRELSDIQSD